ncbi:D-alanine--D-alanine ligase [Gayadomonas joobiniege]|uniref:D-alanine--D-alanine ligase n=1 Tax=Gayadomonas joobiniege TaxID=1234606 RepID=UPI00037FF64A|nr:D-alanine--D-alanine ligase [Gayadomonas joobiniege]
MGKIALLYGGDSAERDISLKSGRAVYQAMQRLKLNVDLIDTQDSFVQQLAQAGYQKAFIALHGRGGEDGQIQGLLEYLKIPFTGSGVLGSALAMDKIRSKQIWLSCGLSTAGYCQIMAGDVTKCGQIIEQLGNQLFVKPAHEGSSIGMSRVHNQQQLVQAIELAGQYDSSILVERFIDGPEYTVAILDGVALPVIRMQAAGEFYDYQAKYESNTTQYHCPCGLSAEEEARVQALAVAAYQALDASGWGRVDVMRDADGQFYLLEANTVPGMTEKSLVPMAAAAAGISFDELVGKILQTAER